MKKAFTPLQIRINKTNRRFVTGFTLIELLIVIIIIGILATMAVPQYQKMVQKAQGAEAINNLGILKRALDMYYAEHGSYTDLITNLDVTFYGEQNRTSKNFYYAIWVNFNYNHPRLGTADPSCRYCIAAIKNTGTLDAPAWGVPQYHLHYAGDIVKTEMTGQDNSTPLHSHNDGNSAHTHKLPLDTT